MTSSTFGELMKKAEQEGASFEVLPADWYVVRCIESDYQPSKNDKPQIKTRWEVIQGPKSGYKGLWNYFTLTTDNANALSIFYRHMTTLGLNNEFMSSLANLDPHTAMKHIAGALLNRTAYVKIKVDTEWNNNKIERINSVPPHMTGAAPAAPSGDPFAAAQAAPAPVQTQPAPAPSAPAPVPATPPVPAPAPVVGAPVPGPGAPNGPPPPPF